MKKKNSKSNPIKKTKKGKIAIKKNTPPDLNSKNNLKSNITNIINNNNFNTININNNTKKINTIKGRNIKKDEILNKAKEIMAYKGQELNDLTYELALKYDKRSYCEFYISLLFMKNTFLFSFCYTNDYNARSIKIDLFFVGFVIYFTINGLFFNDDTMHNIHINKGKYEFIYQLPQILYSTLISTVLNLILKLLALSEGDILDLKKNKKKIDLDKRNKELEKKMNIKFSFYFIISSLLLLFFWYYLAMFCAIYMNTQIHLIKDTLISFGLSLLYPFGISLLPGLFRIPSLSNEKNKRNCLYSISKLIQLI